MLYVKELQNLKTFFMLISNFTEFIKTAHYTRRLNKLSVTYVINTCNFVMI